MKILAVSGSLRQQSVNTAILGILERMLPGNSCFTYFTGLGSLPHFNPDHDREGMVADPAVQAWRDVVSAADAAVVCTPEYALGVPGSLKNGLDWIVSSAGFVDKAVVVISASPMDTGGSKANESLVMTLGMMGAKVLDEATLKIPFIKTKFNDKGEITDEETANSLRKSLDILLNYRDEKQWSID